MTQETLTTLSTTCIVLSGLGLLAGWATIRRRRDIGRHKAFMLSATALAGLFLVAYVTRWYLYGSKPFEGTGTWRALYLAVLAPHVVLAVAVGPLALYLIHLAIRRKDYPTHRRWARVTLPIWLFVSASGWLIYAMLYRITF